ncbi:MAG TPA: isoprenylcysteine carboxylmethyltransferase family protein [Pseudonocardiaceae bacterium]
MTKRVPQVLFAVLLAVLIAGLVRQGLSIGQPPHALAFAFALVYLGWLLAEARITFGKDGGTTPDPTVVPYGLARLLTVAGAVLGPSPWPNLAWWMVVPTCAFVGGIALRLTAIQILGRFYSHRVVRQDGHDVVTTGPYAVVRHPAYTGMVIAHAGLVVLFANEISVPAFVVLIGALAWRINAEEKMLRTVPGYLQYSAGKRRLLPAVW